MPTPRIASEIPSPAVRPIRNVVLFANGPVGGLVAVTDRDGIHFPELQGRFSEKVTAILEAADEHTQFFGWPDIRDGGHLGDWRHS